MKTPNTARISLKGVVPITVALVAAMSQVAVLAQTSEPEDDFPQTTETSFHSEVEIAETFWFRVDTRSPRAVLASMFTLAERARALTREDGYTRENWPELQRLGSELPKLFDLRDVPQDLRPLTAYETFVLTRESLARVPLPQLGDVPGEDEMAERVREGKSAIYRIPGTPFEIGLTDDGPDEGRYQFRRETVQQARSIYDHVKHLPYDPGQASVQGFYEQHFLAPGPLIPFAGAISGAGWWQREFFGQAVWQWLVFAVTLAVFLATFFVLHLMIHRASRNWEGLTRSLLRVVYPGLAIDLVYVFERVVAQQIFIGGDVLVVVLYVTRFVVLGFSVVLAIAIGNVAAEVLLRTTRLRKSKIHRNLARLICRLLSLVVAAVVVLEGMQRIGISLATLIAGAGIGGLAVALAAQGSIKNIIAGIELALDKPFGIGDRVRIAEWDGRIEGIGLRSTVLRTLTGFQVTIPNELAANTHIENIGRRPFIRRDFDIGLVFGTPPEKVARATEILEDIMSVPDGPVGSHSQEENSPASSHPNEAINGPGRPPRIFFDEFRADSLNIKISYWHYPADKWAFFAHAQAINLQIMERFAEEGLEMAFPTQTIYLESEEER